MQSVDRTERLKRILEEQFDLEILLKRREMKTIADEIKRGEELLTCLHQLLFAEDSPSNGTSRELPFVLPEKRTLGRTKEGPRILYECKGDGSFVKLVCCVCEKDMFGNMLGFTNHCRIVHNIVFLTPEDRIEKCGVPVPESEVPDELKKRPQRNVIYERELASLRSGLLASSASSLCSTPKPAEIKEYGEEDIVYPVKKEEDIREKKNPFLVDDQCSLEKPLYRLPVRKDLQDGDSRFYMKRKIIVGNIAKLLKENDESKFTHKWKLYVRGPPSAPSIETFVKKVRVFLHPSYAPNNVVDINLPPFNLIRKGWGEFPIRVQLHFWDLRNKPIDIIHMLQLGGPVCGKYNLGGEKAFDIDLDKETKFMSPDERIVQDLDILKALEEKDAMYSEQVKKYAMDISGNENSLLDGLLTDAIEHFPIIRPLKSVKTNEPYSCALSLRTFTEWPYHKKKATEWQRAHYLRLAVQEKCKSEQLRTKQILEWCRERGYTPDYEKPLTCSHFTCRYCGSFFENFDHYSSHSFDCKLKRKKKSINSFTDGFSFVQDFITTDTEEDIIDDSFVMKKYNFGFDKLNGRNVDWVHPFIEQLNLSNYSQSKSMNNLLHQSVKLFLKELMVHVKKSVKRGDQLTPVHLFDILSKNPHFSFLTNSNLSNKNT